MTPVPLYGSATSLSATCTFAWSPSLLVSESGQICFQCRRDQLLSSVSTRMHPAFAWQWCGISTHSQATTSIERCCMSRQRDQEVWPVTVTIDAPGVTLAGHYQASKLQAGHADPPVSARQGASVFIKLLHASRPRHQLTVPRHISALTVGGHLLSLVRRCSSLCQVIHKILLSAHQSSGNHWRHTSPLPISTFSALGVSHWMRYINTQYVLNCTIFCVVTGSLVPRFVNTCILE